MGDDLNTALCAPKEEQWCPECKQHVQPVKAKDSNLMMNILLSIFTMGIWLIVWACTADISKRASYQCPVCGTKTQDKAIVDATGLGKH
jgi:hypothetical protein